jgi:hypothetical protein
MAKIPAFAKAFAGRWRIVEMDLWDNDFLGFVEDARRRTARLPSAHLPANWTSAMVPVMVLPA